MLIENINSIIEERNTLGQIQADKWDGLTNNQIVLLNACPIELTYSLVVALLGSYSDAFEDNEVKTSSNIPNNPVVNQYQNSYISVDDKLDNILDILNKLITILQVNQLRAEQ